MIDQGKIILTGGGGLLGGELRRLLPEMKAPTSMEFNVTDFDQMDTYVRAGDYELIIHAGAFISPPLIDKDPARALEVNIIGTANVVKLCMRHDLRVIYISTDYVFKGDRGPYREEDPVLPVNKYAWSKLGGECAMQLYDKSLIVRTSFGPNEFPFPKAFVDQWTSRLSVAEFARKLVGLLDQDATGIVHVAGPRRTVHEYAKSLDPNKPIGELRTTEVNFNVPRDTSLSVDRYRRLVGRTEGDETMPAGKEVVK